MPRPVLFLYIQIYMCVCESKSSCLSSELFVSVVQTSNISFAFEHVNQIKKEWQSINVSFFSLFFLFFCCFSQSKNFIENYLTGKRTNEDWKREFHHRIDCLNDNGSYHADFASFFHPNYSLTMNECFAEISPCTLITRVNMTLSIVLCQRRLTWIRVREIQLDFSCLIVVLFQ